MLLASIRLGTAVTHHRGDGNQVGMGFDGKRRPARNPLTLCVASRCLGEREPRSSRICDRRVVAGPSVAAKC